MFVILAVVWTPIAQAQDTTITVTHYGTSYNGRPLGCGGTYYSGDATIVAVGPAHYNDMPCGATLVIQGPNGVAVVTRQDSCSGCDSTMYDLSEAANEIVCGIPAHTCQATLLTPRGDYMPTGTTVLSTRIMQTPEMRAQNWTELLDRCISEIPTTDIDHYGVATDLPKGSLDYICTDYLSLLHKLAQGEN